MKKPKRLRRFRHPCGSIAKKHDLVFCFGCQEYFSRATRLITRLFSLSVLTDFYPVLPDDPLDQRDEGWPLLGFSPRLSDRHRTVSFVTTPESRD